MNADAQAKMIEICMEGMARTDMRYSRERGPLLITQTKLGTVELTYDRTTKTYGIVSLNPDARYEFSGYPAKNTAQALIALYTVEVR